jgi:multimeric flavodoxin WrbA
MTSMGQVKAKKIVGLSCGRVNGNGETLLKAALMEAEKLGIETEVIRAMELRVKPCTGCESCSMAMSRGLEPKCIIKDDDVQWVLEKTAVEDCGLIVAAPVYHARPNGYFMCITERLLPVMFRHPEILKKTRVGGIISVGGGDWTEMALSALNIYVQHTRVLVDQMQVQHNPRPGSVLVTPYLQRAEVLGKRVAEAILMPIEKVKYLGEDTEASCPVCHCNVLQIPGKLSEVKCPVCAVHGVVTSDGKTSRIKWNEEEAKFPRFSGRGVFTHLNEIKEMHEKFFKEDQAKVKVLIKKYVDFGKVVRPA